MHSLLVTRFHFECFLNLLTREYIKPDFDQQITLKLFDFQKVLMIDTFFIKLIRLKKTKTIVGNFFILLEYLKLKLPFRI